MELEDAVHAAILTLKEGSDGALTESLLEIGVAENAVVINRDGVQETVGRFRILTRPEIKDYLANIA
jgi:20S proteasome subunit alpha 2